MPVSSPPSAAPSAPGSEIDATTSRARQLLYAVEGQRVAVALRAPATPRGLVVVAPSAPDQDPTVLAMLRAVGFATAELPPGMPAHPDWLRQVVRCAAREPEACGRPVGVYAVDDVAAAAIAAAAAEPRLIGGVVLRSARLHGDAPLPSAVRVPVLTLLARQDRGGIGSARRLTSVVAAPHRLVLVPQPRDSSWEPAALGAAARVAARWFLLQLPARARRAA